MNWKRSIIGVVAAAPVVALLAYGFRVDPHDIPTPLPGKPAPSFALEVFAPGKPPIAMRVGDTIRSEALLGKVTVLNFWASWCLECRREHKDLSFTALAYADSPVQFVGVLYQDRQRDALAWIEEMGGQSYPSIDDSKSRMAIDYGLYGVPETFIIDAKGVIVHKEVGAVTEALLRRLIDSLLPRTATPDSGVRKSN
jgi:cytochrome c biogenesis protein CcmG, thiol:disulfide interchange protein DsbE